MSIFLQNLFQYSWKRALKPQTLILESPSDLMFRWYSHPLDLAGERARERARFPWLFFRRTTSQYVEPPHKICFTFNLFQFLAFMIPHVFFAKIWRLRSQQLPRTFGRRSASPEKLARLGHGSAARTRWTARQDAPWHCREQPLTPRPSKSMLEFDAIFWHSRIPDPS